MNEPANTDRISGRDFTVGQLRAVLAIWPSLNQIRCDGIGALAVPTVSLLAEAVMSVTGADNTLVLALPVGEVVDAVAVVVLTANAMTISCFTEKVAPAMEWISAVLAAAAPVTPVPAASGLPAAT